MNFVPGLQLARDFYEVLRPQLAGIRHAAGRLDEGSEVIGFDTPMSTDHDWGPRRLQIFCDDPRAVQSLLAGNNDATLFVETPRQFFTRYLGFDIQQELDAADWLSISQQKLLTVTSGAIFQDDIGLRDICSRFTYYPRDVWLFQLASVWTRIGQEEHLVARAGHVGDEIGAKVIAARLVRDAMRLCFLMARRYAPYPKWFGSAFARLDAAAEFSPLLDQVLAAQGWENRDRALAKMYEALAKHHKKLEITKPLTENAAPFFGRPFSVIELHGAFAETIRKQIADPVLRGLEPIGGIDIFSDSTDLTSHVVWREKVRALYDSNLSGD